MCGLIVLWFSVLLCSLSFAVALVRVCCLMCLCLLWLVPGVCCMSCIVLLLIVALYCCLLRRSLLVVGYCHCVWA